MAVKLDGPRLAPASGGAPKQLVILIHGYGADGNDLIGLGEAWRQYLPDAAFVSPHAPDAMPGQFFGGRQWFGLEERGEKVWTDGVRRVGPVLQAFIIEEARKAQLPLGSVAIVGFSQGTMMALQVGFRLPETPAAIVGFSGHLAGAEHLASEIKVKPPVLLVHGAEDDVIPCQALDHARKVLEAAGVSVEWKIRPGLGHGIDPEGLHLAGLFLRKAFGLDPLIS